MGRRRFEHLVIELSVALGVRVPRYELWLTLHECGLDPEDLGREDVECFCAEHLDRFLAHGGWSLRPRARRRLVRICLGFDPRQPTPEEFMARLGGEQT